LFFIGVPFGAYNDEMRGITLPKECDALNRVDSEPPHLAQDLSFSGALEVRSPVQRLHEFLQRNEQIRPSDRGLFHSSPRERPFCVHAGQPRCPIFLVRRSC
jgi:hypothetical protein